MGNRHRDIIPYLDISKISERLIEIDNDTFIDFGLGSGWGIETVEKNKRKTM